LRRTRMSAALVAGLVSLACAPGAHAAVVTFDQSTGRLTMVASGDVDNDVTIELNGGTLTIRDFGEEPTPLGGTCENVNNDATATCSLGLSPTPSVEVSLNEGDDTAELIGVRAYSLGGGLGNDELTGSELGDLIQGGDGDDIVDGAGGNDLLYGGAGTDRLDGGPGGDALFGGDGGDQLIDTGIDASPDVVSYVTDITDPGGVEVSLDGFANDGNFAQDAGGTDNVGLGIENVQGSNFADEISGDLTANFLSGAGGDDVLIGNGGADSFNGATGNDRIEAHDGEVDADIDCDNSMGTHGTADIAVVDANDPTPRNCEDVRGQGTTPPPAPTPTPTPPGTTATPLPTGSKITKTEETKERVKMPAVVGKKIDPARRAVLAKVTGIDLDVTFQRGCAESKDQEVIRQRPSADVPIDTYEGADVPVRLYVCIAERDFLADCDLADLKSDLKSLPKRTDADLGLAVLGRFGKCKVDYDVKMTKKADEARIALAAQTAAASQTALEKADKDKRKAKAQIKAAIDCPTTAADQDLTMTLTEGAVATRGRFGLHESGTNGWTIPAGSNGYTSYVDILVRDKSAPVHAVEATIYIDGEETGMAVSDVAFPTQSPQRVVAKDGYVRLLLTPRKAGTIRLCAVYRTGDDQALTAATQIKVVGPLKIGDTWTTISGRKLSITKNGPVEQVGTVASASGLDQVWDFLVNLFSGTSRSVNQAAGEATLRSQKVRSIQSKWAAAQVSLDGTLDADPRPPTVQYGPCSGFQEGGTVLELTCPQLMASDGTALLGMSTDGAKIIAAGGGNVIKHTGGAIIAAGGGNILSHNGGTAVAPASAFVGTDGATIIAAGGGNAIGPAPSQLIGQDGNSLIGQDGNSLIGQDGNSLVAAGGMSLVSPGGSN
jgi:hypothetical protein